MKQQKKISNFLQIITITIALGVLAIAVLIGCSALSTRQTGGSLWQFGIWTCIYAGCILVMLFHFYRVCLRIGDGDSFSIENADSFTCIERVSYIGSFAALIRVIWSIVADLPTDYTPMASILSMSIATKLLLLSIVEVLAFLIFGFVCRALSLLIKNAAKIKEENELTI